MKNVIQTGEENMSKDVFSIQCHTKNQFIQFLRGVSISAVVMLHCLGKEGIAPLIIKSWLYFCTMMFVFLSGYLTPRSKITNIWKFYKKRLLKVLIPYAVWTALYLLIDGIFTPWQFVKSLVRANASGPLYYLHDYAQLVILTPLIYWMLNRKLLRIVLYCVTPCYIVFNYYLYSNGKYLLVPLCLWLMTAYIVGLEHERWQKKIVGIKLPTAISFVVLGAVAETCESFIWKALGVTALTNTQVKFTSLFYFLSVLVLLAKLRENQKNILSGMYFFTRLGDLSSGIYCSHEVFLNLFIIVVPKGWPNGLLLWILVMSASVLLINTCGKLLPKRVNSWLMF